MRTDEKAFEDRLRAVAHLEDSAIAQAELEDAHATDIAEVLPRLDLDEALRVLQRLEPDVAADVLIELPTESARMYINELPDATVAHYLDILPMDDAIELREELDPDRFEALLHVIPKEDALEIRRLLSYPEDSAGQLMTEDFVDVSPEATMAEILEVIRSTPEEEFETVNYVYVLGPDRHLLGVLSLRRVVRSAPFLAAREVMHEDPITVPVTAHEEEVSRLVAHYGLSALPVLDERGRMVGIITADDAQEVLEEAATEDVLALGGVSGDAEPYLSLGVWQLVKRRLPWLMFLFVAEFFTGSVLRWYTQPTGNASRDVLTTLMLFVPLLIGAGGNAGSQVTTTITRALALGEVSLRDFLVVLKREAAIAVAIGIVLGAVGYGRALMWGYDWHISAIIALALPSIVLWAAMVASLLPLGAKRLGLDPAVMSAPFITTFVDATGMVIFFEIARRFVSW